MVGVCLCLFLCVNTKDGFAALMIASQNGHTATAQILVEAGANKEAKNKVREEKNHTHLRLTRRFEGGSTVWPFFTSL